MSVMTARERIIFENTIAVAIESGYDHRGVAAIALAWLEANGFAEREPVVVDDATTVERVARAIFAVRDDPYDMDEWDDLDSAQREPFECQARAVVAALTPDGQERDRG